MKEEAGKVLEPEDWKTPRKPSCLDQHMQSLYKLTETEAASTGPAGVCIRSSEYILWFPV